MLLSIMLYFNDSLPGNIVVVTLACVTGGLVGLGYRTISRPLAASPLSPLSTPTQPPATQGVVAH